jgi:hypothetical protein
LINPKGKTVAIVEDFVVANEIAAAMNLTIEADRRT